MSENWKADRGDRVSEIEIERLAMEVAELSSVIAEYARKSRRDGLEILRLRALCEAPAVLLTDERIGRIFFPHGGDADDVQAAVLRGRAVEATSLAANGKVVS